VNSKRSGDKYSEQETQRRFEAALRGARTVGQKRMKGSQPKRVKRQANRAQSLREKFGAKPTVKVAVPLRSRLYRIC
jgi:thiamine monophosphate synthase